MDEVAITVTGPDRPGIVADLAEALAALGANLTDSSMSRLRGLFAMTLACTGPATAAVEAALAPFAAGGQLAVTVRELRPEPAAVAGGEPYVMSVHGADRLGIVAAVTRVLAEAGGNITDLTTRLTGPLFVLVAEVELPRGSAAAVRERLLAVAARLGVDVTLRPADPDVF